MYFTLTSNIKKSFILSIFNSQSGTRRFPSSDLFLISSWLHLLWCCFSRCSCSPTVCRSTDNHISSLFVEPRLVSSVKWWKGCSSPLSSYQVSSMPPLCWPPSFFFILGSINMDKEMLNLINLRLFHTRIDCYHLKHFRYKFLKSCYERYWLYIITLSLWSRMCILRIFNR